VTALLGMGGALVATLLGRLIGLYGPGQGAGFLASIVGAILMLLAYRRVRRRQVRVRHPVRQGGNHESIKLTVDTYGSGHKSTQTSDRLDDPELESVTTQG
jgi:Na+/melibiose symporter-like transporter